jgi:hypothetical protein
MHRREAADGTNRFPDGYDSPKAHEGRHMSCSDSEVSGGGDGLATGLSDPDVPSWRYRDAAELPAVDVPGWRCRDADELSAESEQRHDPRSWADAYGRPISRVERWALLAGDAGGREPRRVRGEPAAVDEQHGGEPGGLPGDAGHRRESRCLQRQRPTPVGEQHRRELGGILSGAARRKPRRFRC